MEAFDRIYLDVLRRIRAAPMVHIGGPSLRRLTAFHFGYCWFRPDRESEDSSILGDFQDWINERYQFDTNAMGAVEMLRRIAETEERAFGLFFEDLDVFLLGHPTALQRNPARVLNVEHAPASANLDLLAERPRMYLPEASVGCLRAHLDGYSLAAVEDGHPECSDLEGFEHWVRKEFDLKGLFRWEAAALKEYSGDEHSAYSWAVQALKAFRASKGPLRAYNRETTVREMGGMEP
jgi:hypothetical protein